MCEKYLETKRRENKVNWKLIRRVFFVQRSWNGRAEFPTRRKAQNEVIFISRKYEKKLRCVIKGEMIWLGSVNVNTKS